MAAVLGDAVLDGAQEPGQGHGGCGRVQPPHVVRAGVEQAEVDEAGRGVGVAAADASFAQGAGVHGRSRLAEVLHSVRYVLHGHAALPASWLKGR